MAKFLQLFFILSSLLLFLQGAANQIAKPYIVYMGSSIREGAEISEADHLKMLSAIIPSENSERLTLIHSYHHAFLGFSSMLTEKEAALLSGKDGIISVFPDPVLHLHTTRSWDFLQAESGAKLMPETPPVSDDVIIGIIDSGIWPESPSFNDEGIGQIPSRWKGICMEGSDFKSSACNRKLIGARYYDIQWNVTRLKSGDQMKNSGNSPRDSDGHGTHTASTAAGSLVANASYYGLATGTAKGGSPSSRLAIYKVCTDEGCSGSAILKAIDDAIQDGVDIISISMGAGSWFQTDILDDPIAIGSFHANQKGVLVVCSAGNDGPDPYTVINSSPWIFTVAASTIDRRFQSSILLGNGQFFKGSAINFSNLTRSTPYPLVFAGDIPANSTPTDASNCSPRSLDVGKAAGKIILCVNDDPTVSLRVKKVVAQASQARGLIVIDQLEEAVATVSGDFPFSDVGDFAGNQIIAYIKSTKNPTATILATVDVGDVYPAPIIPSFSSRGPGLYTETIIKPDVTAPGVCILAASVTGSETEDIPAGQKPSNFAIKSGTSMACPHVAGAAAFLKSIHPNWTPSMIKSALMTTATTLNNLGKPITNSSFATATPHDMGAGEINPLAAVDPGLVYDTTVQDYLYFLCYYGYNESIITAVSGSKFICPTNSHEDLISNLNYPSISVSRLDRQGAARIITRILTNVGHSDATYTVHVDAPPGLEITVSPESLVFREGTTRASFDVSFLGNGAKEGYSYGSVTWSDGVHSIHVPFAANVV